MNRVTLRHQDLDNPVRPIFLYDTVIVAHEGIVDQELSDVDIEAVWRRGYNTTLDGVKLHDTVQLFDEVKRQNLTR
jgi:hypothetical protein